MVGTGSKRDIKVILKIHVIDDSMIRRLKRRGEVVGGNHLIVNH